MLDAAEQGSLPTVTGPEYGLFIGLFIRCGAGLPGFLLGFKIDDF
jgi:hypothetical protein